ncbi:MAG: DUF6308 family protein [Yaniella sp.]|uniref:DUF6308 family protein n=2 Tax=Yaniella sp. TaxID=2773929 RepID=UPI00264830F0|nr:DUF6308 family protein [Yaniella sp.]MDN5816695.1 DUF6308 family protein [Yaniella sp.]MDN5912865.1 DUF6308 family protein [Yaniella sp.]MDN6173774.1 DUF6308 family protein [Yaniella sp.]
MTILNALQNISDAEASYYLKKYYGLLQPIDDSPGPYTGAYFESIDIDVAEDTPNRITGSDLYTLTTLQITVRRDGGFGILTYEREAIVSLLQKIPDEPIEDLSPEAYEQYLGRSSPAQELWNLLTRTGTEKPKWGIGSTTASKIMARKRPHLIPIQDRIVDDVIGRDRQNAWELWWQTLTENPTLVERAKTLREHTIDPLGIRPELSTLRVFDVVLWMHGKEQKA